MWSLLPSLVAMLLVCSLLAHRHGLEGHGHCKQTGTCHTGAWTCGPVTCSGLAARAQVPVLPRRCHPGLVTCPVPASCPVQFCGPCWGQQMGKALGLSAPAGPGRAVTRHCPDFSAAPLASKSTRWESEPCAPGCRPLPQRT